MARIAVTGGAGFVGRHFISHALEHGYEVSMLERAPLGGDQLPAKARLLPGDVRDPETVKGLLEDCELVVHLAGSLSSDADNLASIIEGSRTMLRVAREVGVKRFVHVSCLGADSSSEDAFYRAKWQAEEQVRASDLPFVILRPSVVLGGDDGIVKPLVALIRSFPVIPVPGAGQHRTQPMDVQDLVQCLEKALTDDELVGFVISAGGPGFLTFRQLIDLVAGRLGILKPKVLLPLQAISLLCGMLPAHARPALSDVRIAQFRQGVVASPGIVQRMFGFSPQSVVSKLDEYLA